MKILLEIKGKVESLEHKVDQNSKDVVENGKSIKKIGEIIKISSKNQNQFEKIRLIGQESHLKIFLK